MNNSTINDNIKTLISSNSIIKMSRARKKLINSDISSIENELKNFNLNDLIKLKYSLDIRLSNIDIKSFGLIIITVIMTEFIKNFMYSNATKNNVFHSVIGLIISLTFTYYMINFSLSNWYNSYIGKFKIERNKKVLIEIISLEIERKKHQ